MALPENVKWDDSARHERFREQVTALRRQAGRQQQELAAALGLAPHVLSRKLRGLDGARLTHPEVKAIVRTLVAWDALGSQEEALTLLALAGASPASISEDEWARPPLNRLPRVGLRPASSAGLSPVPSLPALPVPPTRLIGRDALRQRVSERLRDPQIRLLTLFGPGGVGKTRLSLAVARTMVPDFPEGIYFVPLGSLHDPSAVPGALVQALALRSTGAGWNTPPDHELIGTALAGKRLLLVLDNFEHLLPAALFLAELLAAAPGPKLLVTSRAVLRLAGESILDVPPLVRPAPPYMTDPAAVAGYPAVQLFLERARAAGAPVELNAQSAQLLAEICDRLDGLPLAIELAAARTRLLPLAGLLSRFTPLLDLLTRGPRDLPARQQTLRSTIAWSYDLLGPAEQRLFRRLSVFAGGFTLEAAAAVSRTLGEAGSVWETASTLLDQSLIRRSTVDTGDLRLEMLQTIREYGLERLAHAGELTRARGAHAGYYLAQAERAAPHLRSNDQLHWLAVLDQDQANLQLATAFLIERAESTGATEDAAAGLRLCIALAWFWYLRGHLGVGLGYLTRALAVAPDCAAELRALALHAMGELVFYSGNVAAAAERARESLALLRALGDTRHVAESLYLSGTVAWAQNRFAQARELLQEAHDRFAAAGDSWGRANTLSRLGRVALTQGKTLEARVYLEAGLEVFRGLGDRQRTAHVLAFLARARFGQGDDIAAALALAEESLALIGAVGQRQGEAYVAVALAEMLSHEGDERRAQVLAQEYLPVQRALGDRASTAEALGYWAHSRARVGALREAGQLYEESVACASAADYVGGIVPALEGLGEWQLG